MIKLACQNQETVRGCTMVQIIDELNLIEELNCTLNESPLFHLKFGELKVALLVLYNSPELTSRILF